MQKFFEIHPSNSQLGLTLGAHALIGLAIAAYVEPLALMLAGVALVSLLALREARLQLRQGCFSLKFDPKSASIEYQRDGQPHFYGKYKVVATRWFAILKLVDKQKNRTLILNPDRFDSIHSYRQLRFALREMEQDSAA